MCGRYHILRPIAAMAELFGFGSGPNTGPAYNIAPTMPVPIVRLTPNPPKREVAFVRWGLIPTWSKDPLHHSPLINARVETVWQKPSFKSAIVRRRCLMPADGFWEWQRTFDDSAHKKQAYRVHRTDDQPMAFGGIWEHWLGADGSEIESVAMLTCEPNRLMSKIHHRMPIILQPDQFDAWLDHQETPEKNRQIADMLVPCAENIIALYAVHNRVGNVRNNDADLLLPLRNSDEQAKMVPNGTQGNLL